MAYWLQHSKISYNPHNILSPYSILYLKILVVKLAQLAALSLSLRALQWPACTIYCHNIIQYCVAFSSPDHSHLWYQDVINWRLECKIKSGFCHLGISWLRKGDEDQTEYVTSSEFNIEEWTLGKLVLLYLEEVAFHSIFGDTTLFPPFTDRIDNIVSGLFPYIKENIIVMFGAEKVSPRGNTLLSCMIFRFRR